MSENTNQAAARKPEPGIKVTSIGDQFYRGRWKFTREAGFLRLSELRAGKAATRDKSAVPSELELLKGDMDLRVEELADVPEGAPAPEEVKPL